MKALDTIKQDIEVSDVVLYSVNTRPRLGIVRAIYSQSVIVVNYLDYNKHGSILPKPKRQQISRNERLILKVSDNMVMNYLMTLEGGSPTRRNEYIAHWGKLYEKKTGKKFLTIVADNSRGIVVVP